MKHDVFKSLLLGW